ncbi:MAG: hypothetical protein ACRETN_04620 [Nevskiales bacterium]
MNSVHRAVIAILAATSLASFSFNALAQEEDALEEDTTASTSASELPAAGVWAGLGLLGIVAVIAGSDSDDSDGPTATVPP